MTEVERLIKRVEDNEVHWLNHLSDRLKYKLQEVGMLDKEIFKSENFNSADRLFLDISTDGSSISYFTKERLQRLDSYYDVWNEDKRRKFAMKTRPARVVQAIKGSDLAYEDSLKLKMMLFDSSKYEVQIKSGTDIQKYYNKDFYDEKRGDLWDSCMSQCPSSFFEFYVKYCQLVVVMNKVSGKITARAVLFNNCMSGNGYSNQNLLSRIYCADDIFKDIMKEWAFANNVLVFNGGYGASHLLQSPTEQIEVGEYMPYFQTDAFINNEFAYLPYLDNFEYAIEADGEYFISAEECYVECGVGEIDRSESNHNTGGGYGYAANSYDWCTGCNGVCDECYCGNNGFDDLNEDSDW